MKPTQTRLRSRLPEATDRPPVTGALDTFWKSISAINYFYWATLAGFDALQRLRPASATEPRDFIEGSIAAHLNLNLPEFDRLLAEQPLRLRYFSLVDAVTFYEEFLLQTLIRELPTRPTLKPEKPLEKYAKNVIDGRYERRAVEIDEALQLDIVSLGSEHELVVGDLTASFLVRNIVVHAGGVVSSREVPTLSPLVPGLLAGVPFPLDEALWRRFLSALWKHAQDIDLLVRVGYRR
ncbi:MAG: hypothetical protein HOO96_40385 [Polyangiaceae bacterium]|nr:hypothetical protein [Polyangiaceae bacterium]